MIHSKDYHKLHVALAKYELLWYKIKTLKEKVESELTEEELTAMNEWIDSVDDDDDDDDDDRYTTV
jgi:hypothetical protein